MLGFPTQKIDHINGNRQDNRRVNLRLVDNRSHSQNQGLSVASTSGHRGVSWNKKYEKWYAYGKRDGQMISLGFFDELDDAAKVAREYREKNYEGYIERDPGGISNL